MTIASDGFGEVIAAMLARAGLAHLPSRQPAGAWPGRVAGRWNSLHARTACTSASASVQVRLPCAATLREARCWSRRCLRLLRRDAAPI
jgi:hypothetical protein